jgi:hypothetical protein
MRQIKTEYLVLAPMVPMVVHIYTFFEAYDHWIIAGAVAITFDVTIFMLFRFLRTKEVRTDKIAYRVVWLGIIIMSLFQLYVNIRVYWHHQPGADAVVMGAIFPVMFGFLSFISARMELKVESYRKKREGIGSYRDTPVRNGKGAYSGVGAYGDTPVRSGDSPVVKKNAGNREVCEHIFSQLSDKSEAIAAAVESGVPKSSAYRYWKEFNKEGALL